MKSIDLLVLVAGVWRISALLVYECGPWDIFRGFRERIGILHQDGDCKPDGFDGSFLSQLFRCVWCLSVYLAIIAFLFYTIDEQLTILILSPFAISAGAIALERWSHG